MQKTVRLSYILCVFVAGAGVCCARAQEGAEAESKVLALERLWGAAAQIRDIKALDAIFDDSMVYVDIDGKLLSKAQVLAGTAAVSPVDIVVQSSVARSHGNVVIVTGILQLKGVEGGKPYLRHGRYLDSWIDINGRWVCVSSMTTAMAK